nr:mandelate racemase/muconate lactonizing enzyme family protein [Hephaestia mangrovi]
MPRDEPYLGPLGPGESINQRGYVVRSGNGTIYPTVDRSVVVRLTAEDGTIGWGETYGICAPKATCEIINDLLAPVLVGQPVDDAAVIPVIWESLYGLMRVRGCSGGFYGDALAALDIALWDLLGRHVGQPVAVLLGDRRRETIPGYVSGLPAATPAARVALAQRFRSEGHDAFKFAAVVSHGGIVEECAALRAAIGPDAALMVDLHWKFDPADALALARALAPYDLSFIEAPVKPEDVAGLTDVARASPIPVAAGEEWHNLHEARLRLPGAALRYVQPEMGHTGITQFCRIAALAAEVGASLAPHATIGTGIFLAASLHASQTIDRLWRHEWQHSVFSANLRLLETDMAYDNNAYRVPTGPGLGIAPKPAFWAHAEAID